MDQQEEWRQIPWAPGYDVSNLGRVRSWRKKVMGVLRPGLAGAPGKKYPMVTLMIEARETKHYVHALVAEIFIGPRPDGYQINHRDGNKENARLDNLEYVTPAANNLHAYATGLKKPLTYEQTFGQFDPKELGRRSAETRKKTGIANAAQRKAWETRRQHDPNDEWLQRRAETLKKAPGSARAAVMKGWETRRRRDPDAAHKATLKSWETRRQKRGQTDE